MSLKRWTAGFCHGLTLIELLVVVSIIAIVVSVALPNYFSAHMRAKITQARANIHVLSQGIEIYYIDHGRYPEGKARPFVDPYGIFSGMSLEDLRGTYCSEAAFQDMFGPIESKSQYGGSEPELNSECYLLYFYYPKLSHIRQNNLLNREGYAVVSIGPDRLDSLIVYHPFPQLLGSRARSIGIRHPNDTIYDPSNGTVSRGDLAQYGGHIPGARILGGR